MRRSRVDVLLVLAMAWLFGACDSNSPHPPRAVPVGPKIDGVIFPDLAPVDPGVIKIGAAITGSRPYRPPRVAAEGLAYALDSCELRAPHQWVVRGHVGLPRGQKSVTATLTLGSSQGDLGYSGWVHHVTFLRGGPFAVAADLSATNSGSRGSEDDSISSCDIHVDDASVPIARATTQKFVGVPGRATTKPYIYTAPADSIQALGIGAPLAHSEDPRTISLYTVWSGDTADLAAAFVPQLRGERVALVRLRTSKDSPCTQIEVEVGATNQQSRQITVTTALDCDAPNDLEPLNVSAETVKGAPGFVWAHGRYSGPPPVAVRIIGAMEVRVSANLNAPRSLVAAVASSLVRRRNLARPSAPRPTRQKTIGAALEQFVAKHPGLTELARFRYRHGWMIFFESATSSEPGMTWEYPLVNAQRVHSGWRVDGGRGDSGTGPRCFYGPSASTAAPTGDAFAYAIAGQPSWGIEALIDGVWRHVPTKHGVAFVDLTARNNDVLPGRLRPVDAGGHVPACFAAENG